MDLPLHRRADSTFCISLKTQNADAECRMQNPAQNDYSVCAACRMQDAGCRIGPKMDSSAWCRMQDAECRMQNQTQRVCPSGAAHSFEPDSASCIRILHPASGAKASGFGPDSAFCILHLHHAPGTLERSGWSPPPAALTRRGRHHPRPGIYNAVLRSDRFGTGHRLGIQNAPAGGPLQITDHHRGPGPGGKPRKVRQK